MFLSKDSGESWQAKSNGLSRWVHHVNIHVNHLQFSPDYQNDETIFLGKTTGVYPSAEAAAETWGIAISPTYGISWNTMARRIDWSQPTDREKADADMVAFLYPITDKWYRIHREVILEQDPNHLLLGDKNMANWHYEWLLPALKKHVDVIAILSYGFWRDEVKFTDKIYAATVKPIFNGDGCYSFAQPRQLKWGVKGFRTGAKSVAEVAKFYRETLEGMMATPYVVGWHHCGYLQQWDEAERGDSHRNEMGSLTLLKKNFPSGPALSVK